MTKIRTNTHFLLLSLLLDIIFTMTQIWDKVLSFGMPFWDRSKFYHHFAGDCLSNFLKISSFLFSSLIILFTSVFINDFFFTNYILLEVWMWYIHNYYLRSRGSIEPFQEKMANIDSTLKELAAVDLEEKSLCILYLILKIGVGLKSKLIHFLPIFRCLTREDANKY